MDSFYVVLPSNTPNANNKTSSFTVKLPDTIDVDGHWTVALSSIVYPLSFSTLGSDSRQKITYLDIHPLLTSYVPESSYESIDEMEKFLQETFFVDTKHFLTKEAKIKYRNILEEKNIVEYNRRILGIYYCSERHRFCFVNSGETKVKKIELSEQLCYMLGFANCAIAENRTAKYNPDLSGGIRQLYVYAPNLVENTIVGNVTVPLLRIVNVKGKIGEVSEDIYASEHHHRLLSKRFSEISIEIRSSAGNLINFHWGSCVLILHFKRSLF